MTLPMILATYGISATLTAFLSYQPNDHVGPGSLPRPVEPMSAVIDADATVRYAVTLCRGAPSTRPWACTRARSE